MFLFHLFRDAPSLYILPRRVALHECIHGGGVENLQMLLRCNCSRVAVVTQDTIESMLGKMTVPELHEARKVEWICQYFVAFHITLYKIGCAQQKHSSKLDDFALTCTIFVMETWLL